jgi:hypothetical protein
VIGWANASVRNGRDRIASSRHRPILSSRRAEGRARSNGGAPPARDWRGQAGRSFDGAATRTTTSPTATWSPALSFLPRLVSVAPFTRTPPLAISTLAPPPLAARPVALSSESRAM